MNAVQSRVIAATLVAIVALAGAVPVQAQSGINLSWNDCGESGILQKTFACNTNLGSSTLVGSVISGANLTQLVGMEAIMLLQTNQPTLSNWWQLGAGGCRYSSPPILSASFDFASQFNCVDPWAGAAGGSITYEPGYPAANMARIRVTCGVPGPVSINGVDEYYQFKVTFTHERSTGAGSCSGCTDGVCLMLNQVRLIQSGGAGSLTVFTPIVRNYVHWQPLTLGEQCPFYVDPPVPARAPTWGAIKSLYR